MRLRLLPVSVALTLSALGLDRVPAHAAVPSAIAFQGRLTTPAGTPVPDTTTQALTFRIFDAPANGTLLWSQAISNVAVEGGLFTISLDFSAGFTAGASLESVLSGTPYLEVQAGADPPMTPRLPLSSSPYALRASLEMLSTGSVDAPVLLGSANTGGNTVSVTVSGRYAYVLNPGLRLLQAFDISNPAALTPKGSAGTGIDPSSLAISGNFAYVVNLSSNTLQVFDISNPTTPVLKGTTTTALSPTSVTVSGAFAYVVNRGNNSLQVFDVSDPASPTLKGSTTTENDPKSVAVSGHTVYVVNHLGESLQVFDAENPAAPTLKGSAPTGDAPFSVTVSGGHAYVVNASSNTLQVFDVSNPSAPVLRGTAQTAIEPVSVAVSGKDAYVGCFGDGVLEVFDVSDPTAPKSRGSSDAGGAPLHPFFVALSEGFAYITGGNTLHTFALNRMRVTGSLLVQGDASVAGRVGIGTSNPVSQLDVVGDIRCTSLVQTSSQRYKQDIAPLIEDFSRLLLAEPRTYTRTGSPGRREIGYLAEEIDALGLTPLVAYDGSGRPDGLSYDRMVLYLVEIAKEQKARIAGHETEITALKAQNAEMEGRLRRLEERLDAGGTPAR